MTGERTNDGWLAGLRAHDAQALEELRAFLLRGLQRGLRGRGDVDPSDLEDYAQEAVLRILERLDSFEGRSRFTTWAVSIAVRTALTALRRRRWGDVSLEELGLGEGAGTPPKNLTSTPDPSGALARQDLLAALEHAIDNALTEKQRTLIRAELAGMPTAELAAQMGTNSNALYKLYHDARKKLRLALAAAGFDEDDVRSELTEASQER